MTIVPSFSCSPRTGPGQALVTFTDLTTGTDPTFTQITLDPYLTYTDIATQGKYALTCTNGDYVYYSTNYGVTWTKVTSLGVSYWSGAAISSARDDSGAKIPVFYVCNNTDGRIYHSFTEGASWISSFVITSNINKVRCSADGIFVVTSKIGGHIWVSNNYGDTWVERINSPTSSDVYDLDVSDSHLADAAIIISLGTTVWISTDSGITWTEQTDLPTTNGNYSVTVVSWGDDHSHYAYYAGGSDYLSPLYKMTSYTGIGPWFTMINVGINSWQDISKGLVESAYARQVISAVSDNKLFLIDIYDASYKWYDLSVIPVPILKLAISNHEVDGCTVIVLSESESYGQYLYVGKVHITRWFLDSGSGYVLINNYESSLQPFTRTLDIGIYGVQIIIDYGPGVAYSSYINIRAPVLNTLVINGGRIQSWSKQTIAQTVVRTPRTHTISVTNGKIMSWNSTLSGTRPDPEMTRAVVINKGHIQSWST